ncbi:MAG: hypothetical protein QN213_13080 [Armatimonadota bacterium]|nr:hypothetical protein [Armatimonadota bacterium]MDR7531684.1 hypothetical protein [Armatimonadota bacterium]MDR7608116.1 hypothetical protein [Armatimonadota bacterium]
MNGQPVVAAMLSKFYAWDFHQKVGLSADQMWRQVQSAGYLGVQGNWFSNPDGSSPREQFLWDQYRLFFYGPATQDIGRSKDAWAPGLNSSQGRAIIADIVNFHKRKPYLLFWLVVNEYNPDALPISQYRPVHDYVRSLDPARLTGDIYVLAGSTSTREQIYQIGGVMLPEISVDQSGNADHPFARLLGELLLQERVWQQGIRFIRGVSTTPIGEFIPMGVHPCGDHRPYPYPYVELERWYLTQVALNARAFEVLWGPSQTEGGCSPSQTAWGSWARVMEVWTWQTTLVRHLTTTLRSVILSPSSFSRIVGATPPFEEPSQFNGFVYRGIYAAQKQAGATYLAVVNTQSNDLQNVTVPVSGSAAVDLLTGERFPVSSGQLRWSTFPALKARILRVEP